MLAQDSLEQFLGILKAVSSECISFCPPHTPSVSGNPAQESVSLMLPLDVIEGSVRATVLVTGKEFAKIPNL